MAENREAAQDDVYSDLVAKARQGDASASLKVLHAFVDAVAVTQGRDGRRLIGPRGPADILIPPSIADYLAACFKSIVEGVPPEKALGLSLGEPGRRGMTNEEHLARDAEWCGLVSSLVATGRYQHLREAKAEAARQLKVGVPSVERAWKNKKARSVATILQRLSESKER